MTYEEHVNCYLSLSTQIKAQHHEAMRIQKEQQLIAKQQQILREQPFVTDIEVSWRNGKLN